MLNTSRQNSSTKTLMLNTNPTVNTLKFTNDTVKEYDSHLTALKMCKQFGLIILVSYICAKYSVIE